MLVVISHPVNEFKHPPTLETAVAFAGNSLGEYLC